jgi:hypothetical protein
MAIFEEQERWWLASTTPEMLYLLVDAGLPVSLRKRMLFNVACCRRIWALFRDDRCRRAIQLAEDLAVGTPTGSQQEREIREGLSEACEEVRDEPDSLDYCLVYAVNNTLNGEWVEWDSAAYFAARAYDLAHPEVSALIELHRRRIHTPEEARLLEAQRESAHQADLVRDIFGNPFRPVTFDPTWRTPTVQAVAWSIYQDRRFSEVGVLGDALEDAGCTCEAILDHLHLPGEHVLGCWVVDRILGLE